MMILGRRRALARIAATLLAAWVAGPAVAGGPAPLGPDVFGTVALPVTKTSYDDRWRHAMARQASGSLDRLTQSVAGATRAQQLSHVQASVNRLIAFREDMAAHGRDDVWTPSSETLDAQAGDCEDFAILKLQALRSLGFDPRDLYLSVGRDRDRGDHALALVRIGDRLWVLDNLGTAPVLADAFPYFEPMFTLAEGGAWLHGRRTAAIGSGAARRAR